MYWNELVEQKRELNATEQIFMKTYELQQVYKNPEKVFNLLYFAGIDPLSYWLPAINTENDTYLTQYISNQTVRLENTAILYHPRFQPYSLHRHEFYECIVVLEGNCTNIVEHHHMDMQRGDVCMLPPGIRHMIGVFDKKSIVLNFIFSEKFISGHIKGGFPGNGSLSKIFGGDNYYYTGNIERDEEAQFLLTSYARHEGTALFDTYGAALLYRLNCLGHCCSCDNPSVIRKVQMDKVIFYLQTNYRDATLGKLGKEFGYSSTHMGYKIREELGISFTELLRRIRICQASLYLTSSDMSIARIAETVGYDEPQYFTRIFTNMIGMTPSAFRRKAKIHFTG